jgi:hypothetical protein
MHLTHRMAAPPRTVGLDATRFTGLQELQFGSSPENNASNLQHSGPWWP